MSTNKTAAAVLGSRTRYFGLDFRDLERHSRLMLLLTIARPLSLFLASVSISGAAMASQGQPPKQLEAAPSAPEKSAKSTSSARVFFKNLKDGQTLASGADIKVIFGVEGMKVRPAGELVEGTGHHHLIIDAPATPEGQVVPADEKHLHFGKGQEEATIRLAPGAHTLTLQFADGAHRSYGPKLSATIRVNIK